jgi:hypothetical protein
MFKFWKTKQIDLKDLAKVEFAISTSGEKPKLNIELLSYDEQSLVALCDILEIFQGERVLIEMLNFIQSHFINSGKEEQLLKIFMILQEKSMLDNILNHNKRQEPCIKPSEMIT